MIYQASQLPQIILNGGGPSITDWITAITTAAAALAAGIAAVLAGRQLKLLAVDRKSDSEARRREQAAKFSAWPHFSQEAMQLQLIFMNASASPVYDVKGTVFIEGKKAFVFERGTLGPDSAARVDERASGILRDRIDDMLRRELGNEAVNRKTALGARYADSDVLWREGDLVERTTVEVSFRDAAGVQWKREGDGQLVRVAAMADLPEQASKKSLTGRVRRTTN